MLKFEKKGSSLELHLWSSYQNKKKLIKAFIIALSCHVLFFTLFVPKLERDHWKALSPPIMAYVDEPPPPLEDDDPS